MQEVRRLVYSFKYEGEAVHGPAESCVPLQLSRLFARLQLSSCQAVSTRALIASFGWSRAESFKQHDVQELCRVLFNALSKFGVMLEPQLFEGSLTSTLRCLRCGHRSSRQEAFCDLSLDVSNSDSLEHALRAFTAWEVLPYMPYMHACMHVHVCVHACAHAYMCRSSTATTAGIVMSATSVSRP